MFQLTDNSKIGTILVFLGVGFLLLGMMLFFDSRLLAMGNIMFLTGFTLLSGIKRTGEFFGLYGMHMMDRWRKRWPGLITFMGGVFMVLSGWSVFGIFVECFGFLNLFGSFFPLVLSFLRSVPIIGDFLSLPIVANGIDRISASSKAASSVV